MPGVAKTATEIARVAARVFGAHLGDGRPSGRKILRAPLIGERLAAYYPKSMAALDPLFTAPDETRRKGETRAIEATRERAAEEGRGEARE